MSGKQLKALSMMVDMATETGHKIVWTPDENVNDENQITFIKNSNVKLKNGKVLDSRSLKSANFSVVHVTPIVILDMI